MKICLITNDPDSKVIHDVTENSTGDNDLEIILLQDAVRRTDFPTGQVYVSGDDLRVRGKESPYPSLDHKEMVERIFSADRVLCL